jgi:hypothetical protein
MNKEIGLENLPNCYIKTIEISEINKRQNLITVSVFVKDAKFKDSLHWYDNKDLSKFLKVSVILSSNQSLTNDLKKGNLALDKRKINRKYTNKTGIISGEKSVLFEDYRHNNNDLETFEYIFKFKVSKKEQNVDVFACVSMNVQEYATQNKINLESSDINTYTGPVTSEVILKNSEVPRETMVFTSPGGETYSGPVHVRNRRYMEGSYHTNQPHSILSIRKATDSKIKDYRSIEELVQPKRRLRAPRAFEGPWMSHTDDGDLYGFFTLNLKAMMIEKTRLGRKISALSDYMFDKLLAEFRFKNIELFNESFQPVIRSNRGTPRIGKRKSLKRNRLVKSKQRDSRVSERRQNRAMIREIALDGSLHKKTFAFSQQYSDSFKGLYKYGLELSFNDPTISFVENMITELKQTINQFNPYYVRSNRPSSTTEGKTRFTQVFVDTELERFTNESAAPWNLAIKNYVELLAALKNLTKQESNAMLHKTLLLVHPKYGTPKSLEHFYSSYKNLYGDLVRYFRVRPKNNSNIKGGNTRRQPKNSISFKIDFKETVSFEDKDKNLNYFDDKKDGIPTLTKKKFIENSKKEFNKFFKEKPSFSRTQISTVGKKETDSMGRIDNNLVSYMTPKKIKLKKKKIMLNKKPVSFNTKEVNNAIDSIKNVKKPENITQKKNKKTNFTIKVAKPIENYLDKSENKTKNTRENLGKTTVFNNAEEKLKTSTKPGISKEIKKGFSKKKKKNKISRNKFKVDNKVVQRIVSDPKKAERLPISLKAILGSESKSVRNNLFKTKKDQISSRKTTDIFDLIYTSPVEIKYYHDNKWEMIDSKILGSLPNSVICKIEPFSVQGLTEQEDKINISNKFFLLDLGKAKLKNTFLENITMDDVIQKIDELPRYKDEYFTNSPIKQAQNRLSTLNGKNSGLASPNEELLTKRRTPKRSTKNAY